MDAAAANNKIFFTHTSFKKAFQTAFYHPAV